MNDNKTLIERNESKPDIDQATLNKLSEFIVSLIQALLRTGYYTSDHPQSEMARTGLYAKFRDLALKKSEFTFLIQTQAETQKIFIEGMLPEPCDLKALMLAGMAELYDEKLIEFLEKKELISLTLKQKMEEQEFHDFIDVMSQPILTDIDDKDKRDRFTFYLQERGVRNISFVFNEDLIRWERNIPWRVWIALSRLRKDISLIPILRDLDREDLKEVKKEVVSDVLRPLADPRSAFSTLVNSDLIHSKVMEEAEIEKYIIACLSDNTLFANVEEYINTHTRLKKLVDQKSYQEKLLRILNGFKVRLIESENKKSDALLEKLYKNELISFDELPPRLKEEIFLKKFLKTFLDNPDSVLTRLEHTEDEEQYHSLVKSVFGIMPRLIEQDRIEEFHNILRILQRHTKEGSNRGKQSEVILEKVGSSDIPLKLKNKFMTGKKETRLLLYPIFRKLEACMTVPLLAVIEETDDQWVRKNAIELFLQMGSVAVSYLEQALKVGRFKEVVVVEVIKALGTMGNQETKEKMTSLISEYCHHQDPGVRQYVLTLLTEVEGVGAEETLLKALDDSNLEVRKSAMKCLGMIKSKKAFPILMEMLKKTKESPSEDTEQIENQIYWVLRFMDNRLRHDDKTPEEILLEVLKQSPHTSRISRLLGRKASTLSEEATCTICDSLARIGTELSEPVLTELARDRKKPWGIKAQQALERIQKRHSNKAQTTKKISSVPGPTAVQTGRSVSRSDAALHPTD